MVTSIFLAEVANESSADIYIMSVSSPKEEVEAGGPSPENSDHMDRGEAEAQAPELYEFDVKEQDRWLPIANGWFPVGFMQHHPINCAYCTSDAAQ